MSLFATSGVIFADGSSLEFGATLPVSPSAVGDNGTFFVTTTGNPPADKSEIVSVHKWDKQTASWYEIPVDDDANFTTSTTSGAPAITGNEQDGDDHYVLDAANAVIEAYKFELQTATWVELSLSEAGPWVRISDNAPATAGDAQVKIRNTAGSVEAQLEPLAGNTAVFSLMGYVSGVLSKTLEIWTLNGISQLRYKTALMIRSGTDVLLYGYRDTTDGFRVGIRTASPETDVDIAGDARLRDYVDGAKDADFNRELGLDANGVVITREASISPEILAYFNFAAPPSTTPMVDLVQGWSLPRVGTAPQQEGGLGWDCYNFNGGTYYTTAGDPAGLADGPTTLISWVRPDDSGGTYRGIWTRQAGSFYLGVNQVNGNLDIRNQGGPDGDIYVNGVKLGATGTQQFAYTVGEWYQVAFVFRGAFPVATPDWWIGHDRGFGDRSARAAIGQFGILKGALSSLQIQSLYQKQKLGVELPVAL